MTTMTDDSHAELASLPREELVERARALSTVLRVAQAVTSAHSVEELAARFVEAVAAYTQFPSVVVWRYVPAADGFEIVALCGFDESKLPPRKIMPAKGSLTGLAAERRRIMTSDDIEHDERVDPSMRVALAANEYTSAACVPVVHQDELMGSFNLIYPRGTALREGDRHLLEALATTLAVAMAQREALGRERELEAQARRAQQLDSLGVLAGGIAHDFNNLLTGIVGNVDFARLLALKANADDIVTLLAEALGAAGRAAALVKQLLTFSRGGAPSLRATEDLGSLLREVSFFAARGTSVRCEVELDEPLGVVEIDAGQIGQVIQNLVLNACQASSSGSSVFVRARRERRADAFVVRIEVSDSGSGIAPAILPRIFEPFFSARSGGTGLGLAVSDSIVRRHGGRMTVESELGSGTTFAVELPASERAPVPEIRAQLDETRFSGAVLVMDDEDTVRRVTQRLLERLGFSVEAASHGTAALELARRAKAEGRRFELALLDLTIVGGLGAADIADELRGILPGIRVVIATGYALGGGSVVCDAQLRKPYSIQELANVIAGVLGSNSE